LYRYSRVTPKCLATGTFTPVKTWNPGPRHSYRLYKGSFTNFVSTLGNSAPMPAPRYGWTVPQQWFSANVHCHRFTTLKSHEFSPSVNSRWSNVRFIGSTVLIGTPARVPVTRVGRFRSATARL